MPPGAASGVIGRARLGFVVMNPTKETSIAARKKLFPGTWKKSCVVSFLKLTPFTPLNDRLDYLTDIHLHRVGKTLIIVTPFQALKTRALVH